MPETSKWRAYRNPVKSAWPFIVIFLAFALVAAQWMNVVRVRDVLLLSAVLLALTASKARSRISAIDRRRALIILLFTVFLFAGHLLTRGAESVYAFGSHMAFALLGWTVTFSVLQWEFSSFRLPSWLKPTRWVVVGWFVGAAAVLTLAHLLIRGSYVTIIDEVLYRLQAHELWCAPCAPHVDPALSRFFLTRLSYIQHGYVRGQYPMGWPFVLAIFSRLHAMSAAPAFCGLATLILVYQIGKESAGRTSGFLASLILGTSYWFVYDSSTYFSHGLSILLVTASAWLLLRAERHCGRQQLLDFSGAGLLLGSEFITRPLTGVAILFTFWFCLISRARIDLRRLLLCTVIAMLAALLPAAFQFDYNLLYSGNPLRYGYEMANGSFHRLGFGIRGQVTYAPDGIPKLPTEHFTPRVAVRNLWSVVGDAAADFTPFVLLGPLAFLRWRHHPPWKDILACLPFLILPGAYFFWYFPHVRFYSELLPFLALALAFMFRELLTRAPAVGMTLLGFCLAGEIFVCSTRLSVDAASFRYRFLPCFRTIAALEQHYPHVLVFVRDGYPPNLFEALWLFNAEQPRDRIVIARDLGDQDYLLERVYPDHDDFAAVEASPGKLIIQPRPRSIAQADPDARTRSPILRAQGRGCPRTARNVAAPKVIKSGSRSRARADI